MKRTQRITIEFRQRELTLTVAGARVEAPGGAPDVEPGAEPDEPAGESPLCPTCGSFWIAVEVSGREESAAHVESVYGALEQAGLHLQRGASGALKICRKSLDQIKEKHL